MHLAQNIADCSQNPRYTLMANSETIPSSLSPYPLPWIFMAEVRFSTPRGVELAGTFINPVDTQGAAVIFAHGFLVDRHAVGWFDKFAARYRSLGYATLMFDFSGCGDSDEDVITLDHQIEDMRSASGWLADQGFSRQIVHAHGFGAEAALAAHSALTEAYVLTSPSIEPQSVEWERVFSEQQLTELEQFGHTRIPNDASRGRDHFIISKKILSDLSLADPARLLDGVDKPILMIFDAIDHARGMAPLSDQAHAYMNNLSREVVLDTVDFSAGVTPTGLDAEWNLAKEWVLSHCPPIP